MKAMAVQRRAFNRQKNSVQNHDGLSMLSERFWPMYAEAYIPMTPPEHKAPWRPAINELPTCWPAMRWTSVIIIAGELMRLPDN